MPRFSAPITTLAGLVIVASLLAGCAGSGVAAAQASPSGTPNASAATATAARPTFDLTVTGGSGAGSYTTDKATSLDVCTHAKDGSWRFMYAGGDPWIQVDLLVGPHAAEADHHADVAAEITIKQDYLWIDPAKMRGGDPVGRSTAAVDIKPAAGSTTFVLSATTPYRTPGGDGPPATVSMTTVCPT